MSHDPELEKRLPPHDREAERAILGSILRDNAAFDEVQRLIGPGDFSQFAHKTLFECFADLIGKGKPADPVTVIDWLHAKNLKADVGAPAYIVDVWEAAPAAANVKYHAEIIRRKATLRRLIQASADIQREAFESAADSDAVLSRAEEAIYDIGQSRRTGEVVAFRDAVQRGLEALDLRAGRNVDGECDSSIRYGWGGLDRLTGGLHPRELVILAARPSVGKTLIAMNIVENVAANGGKVFFASIEQGMVELVHRTLGKRAKVSSGKFRTAKFTNDEREQISAAAADVQNWTIWINDHSSQSVADIASDARRLRMRHGLDLLVVDYLQIAKSENMRANRNEQVGQMSWRLKQIAKDLDIPVICLSQLNRGVENRPDAEPRLSDLRESGEIEQNADCVIMLHKPDAPDHDRPTDVIKFLIRKQRNGPLGDLTMVHNKKLFEVREMEAYS